MARFCHDCMSNLQYANFLKFGVANQDSQFPYVILVCANLFFQGFKGTGFEIQRMKISI